jgi:predicted Abi (CAAX) family protease
VQSYFRRVKAVFFTIPHPGDWLQTIGLLLIFALVYLPIGFEFS